MIIKIPWQCPLCTESTTDIADHCCLHTGQAESIVWSVASADNLSTETKIKGVGERVESV